MPLGIGPMEIVVVLVIALVVVGPKKLPGMARQVGGGVREFRDSLQGGTDGRDADETAVGTSGTARHGAV